MSTTPIYDTIPYIQYVAAPGATQFAFPFWIGTADDLSVYVNTVLANPSVYSVDGVQETAGGDITFATPMTGGEIITIAGDFDIERLTGFQPGGPFRANAINLELSTMIAIMLQLNRDIKRKFGIPLSSTLNPDSLELPAPVDGKALIWDGVTGKLKNSTLNPDDAPDLADAVAQAQAAAALAVSVAANTQPQTVITGTNKTVNLANDPGKQFIFTNAAAISVYLPVPAAGDVGKFISFLQLGAGRIQFSASIGSGNAVLNSQNLLKTRAIYAKAAVEVSVIDAGGTLGWILTGDLAA